MQLKSGEKEPELSSNLQEDNTESLDNVDDENADEYGYFSEFEKGTHHMQHQQAQQLMIVLPNCWKRVPFRQVAQFSLVYY